MNFETIVDWLKARWEERSTWDGTVIIALGVVALVLQGLLPYAAWAAIAYGAWTLVTSEDNTPGE